MRRALAICFAILVAMAATRSVMAQDVGREELLEILKGMSEEEFAELKAQARARAAGESQLGPRLEKLDRSVDEYLSRNGDDSMGTSMSYRPGHGFGFDAGDAFAVWVGGLFQFSYSFVNSDGGQDTNNFDVEENRFRFEGHVFYPELTFLFEFDGGAGGGDSPLFAGLPPTDPDIEIPEFPAGKAYTTIGSGSGGTYGSYFGSTGGGVRMLDAWVNYEWMDWLQVRAGQMKVPFGRQWQTHERNLAFANRSVAANVFNFNRDVGVMLHDTAGVKEEGQGIFEYALGLFNGEGPGSSGNDNNWVEWVLRVGIHPWGWVPYAEGDRTVDGEWADGQFRGALAASVLGHDFESGTFLTGPGGTPLTAGGDTLAWELDAVATWNGLFLLAEYFDRTVDPEGGSDMDDSGWYAQGGYRLPNTEWEVLARWGQIDWDSDSPFGNTHEWAVGAAYYFHGHFLKVVAETGGTRTQVDGRDNNLDSPFFLRLLFQLDW